MHRRACKQYIFWSYNTSVFNIMHLGKNPFVYQCENKDTKGLMVSDFALLLVVFM